MTATITNLPTPEDLADYNGEGDFGSSLKFSHLFMAYANYRTPSQRHPAAQRYGLWGRLRDYHHATPGEAGGRHHRGIANLPLYTGKIALAFYAALNNGGAAPTTHAAHGRRRNERTFSPKPV